MTNFIDHQNGLNLMHGDCLERMKEIPNGSVDAVICDPPYGTTALAWDSPIPFDQMWEQYKRVLKKNGVVVLTAAQPFASALVMSNLKWFRYDLIWDKVNRNTGALNANRMPLRRHEIVLVFYGSQPTYNPQWLDRPPVSGGPRSGHGKHTVASDNYGRTGRADPKKCHPSSIIEIPGAGSQHTGLHPTQKPVPLCEHLIKMYTNPGDVVLDNSMGSGTTGVACLNTGRRFIGIEFDEGYFNGARNRLVQHASEIVPALPLEAAE